MNFGTLALTDSGRARLATAIVPSSMLAVSGAIPVQSVGSNFIGHPSSWGSLAAQPKPATESGANVTGHTYWPLRILTSIAWFNLGSGCARGDANMEPACP